MLRFNDNDQSTSSLKGLRRALEMITYTLPANGQRTHIHFLHANISSLENNLVLRALVDCVTVILRSKAHVSSRNMYLRAINIYHRQSIVANTRFGPCDQLTIACTNTTALALVGLHGFINVHYTSGTTPISERAEVLDMLLIGANHLQPKPISIDVEADILVIQFSSCTSLI